MARAPSPTFDESEDEIGTSPGRSSQRTASPTFDDSDESDGGAPAVSEAQAARAAVRASGVRELVACASTETVTFVTFFGELIRNFDEQFVKF